MAGDRRAGAARDDLSSPQDDDDLEKELRKFLAGRRVWPSYREFVAADRRSLREAVSRRHGARYWATRVGVQWVDRRPGYAPRWTEERVAKELEQFLAARDVWPPVSEFQAAGLGPLRDAIKRHGGVEVWARKFGVPRANERSGSRRIWDEQRLELTIGPLVRSLGRWPTKNEFRDARLESAQAAAYRYGGVDYWRERLGVAVPARRASVPRRRVWTGERIERELAEYCAGRSEWPTQKQFICDGKGRLYNAASLRGGVAHWQKQLGLPPSRRTYFDRRQAQTAPQTMAARVVASRRGRPWSEAAIRDELTRFLQGWEIWPTYEQFIQGGAKGLRDALYRIGGVEYWAKEMGLPGGDRSQGGVRRWTDEAIRATLARFFADRPDWPSQREFDEAGLHALREALRHYGGPERWAKEMGVVLPPGMARSTARPRRAPTRADKPPRKRSPWDNKRIASELGRFLDGRDEWPRYREFVEAGQARLYQAVLRNGGTRTWARRTGAKWVKRHGGRHPPWTEDRVREELTVFLAGRSRWPRRVEFETEGHRSLLNAVTKTGGAARWARVFGLEGVTAPRGSV